MDLEAYCARYSRQNFIAPLHMDTCIPSQTFIARRNPVYQADSPVLDDKMNIVINERFSPDAKLFLREWSKILGEGVKPSEIVQHYHLEMKPTRGKKYNDSLYQYLENLAVDSTELLTRQIEEKINDAEPCLVSSERGISLNIGGEVKFVIAPDGILLTSGKLKIKNPEEMDTEDEIRGEFPHLYKGKINGDRGIYFETMVDRIRTDTFTDFLIMAGIRASSVNWDILKTGFSHENIRKFISGQSGGVDPRSLVDVYLYFQPTPDRYRGDTEAFA